MPNPPEPNRDASPPDERIAVVMITYNRRDEALATIGRMLDLPERPRLVVVDNGSTDGTGEAIAEDEAWDWLQAHPNDWDVVLVDLFLRAGSGLGLLHRMGNRGPGQKAIVFSNYADATIRKRCAQLGVDAVFDKSTEVDGLMEYLARLPDASAAG